MTTEMKDMLDQIDEDKLNAAVKACRTTPDEVHDALIGMLCLVQLICERDDVPSEAKQAMRASHLYANGRSVAKAYL